MSESSSGAQSKLDLPKAPSRLSDDLQITAVAISIKALLLIFAGQTSQIVNNTRMETLYDWLNIWNRWDTIHYRKLAEFGYNGAGDMRPSMVFYPLYPWLIRGLTSLTSDYFISAFIISTVASVISAVMLFKLISLDYSRAVAMRSVWFFMIFPTSYFLHIGYTESLFMALIFSSFYAARREDWQIAGILGAFACMTRANGLILIPALGVEIAIQVSRTRKFNAAWLWLALMPIGFIVYLAINQSVAGNAFAFVEIRKEAFFISPDTPWNGVISVVTQMTYAGGQGEIVGVQEVIYVALGLACSVVSWFRLRPAYSVWITLSWLLIISVSFVASVPRYTLTMFPVFILFAMLAGRRVWLAVITFWSLIYLGIFSSFFVGGRWAF